MDPDDDLRAARRAAAALGLDPSGAVVIRRAATTAVRLPAADAFARVHPVGGDEAARREVAVARVLEHTGVPAARLVDGLQPVATTTGPVTVWRWLERHGRADLVDLAVLAARLHTATADPHAAVPAADPLAAARAQVDWHGGTDAALLRDLVDRYATRWPAAVVGDPLGTAVIHADLHLDNVVPTADGAVLVDLELAGIGPCSYDLAAVAVAGRRYGVDPARVDAAFSAYLGRRGGDDPRRWAGFDLFCDVYELWVTAWAVAHRGASPAAEAEAARRMTRWRTGVSPTWTLG